MSSHLYLAWLFIGFMTHFFYKRFRKTEIILLVPVYFVFFLLFGICFISGLYMIIYLLYFK